MFSPWLYLFEFLLIPDLLVSTSLATPKAPKVSLGWACLPIQIMRSVPDSWGNFYISHTHLRWLELEGESALERKTRTHYASLVGHLHAPILFNPSGAREKERCRSTPGLASFNATWLAFTISLGSCHAVPCKFRICDLIAM